MPFFFHYFFTINIKKIHVICTSMLFCKTLILFKRIMSFVSTVNYYILYIEKLVCCIKKKWNEIVLHLQNLASDQQYPCGEISTTVISKVIKCSTTQGTGSHWIFLGAHGANCKKFETLKQSLFQVSEVSKKQKPKLNSCFGKSNARNIFLALKDNSK